MVCGILPSTKTKNSRPGQFAAVPDLLPRSPRSLRPQKLPNKNSATSANKSFTHLQPREAAAIVFYRARMHLSISHIAQIVERSTRTVAKLLSKNSIHKLFDKRHLPPKCRHGDEHRFIQNQAILSWFYSVWVDFLVRDIRLLDGRTGRGEKPP